MNIVLTKSYGKASRFGIGAYIDMLIAAFSTCPDHELIVAHINTCDRNVLKECTGNTTHIFIPRNNDFGKHTVQDEIYIDFPFAGTIYSILYDHLGGRHPDILHLNSPLEVNIARTARERGNAFILYTVHVLLWNILYNQDFERFSHDWENNESNVKTTSIRLEMDLCDLASRIICLTPGARSFVADFYKTPFEKIDLVHNGIVITPGAFLSADMKKGIRKKYGFPERITIIYSGRLIYEKGLDFLIEALDRLHKKDIGFHLIVCGDGDYSYYLDKCAGFTGKVSFVGFVGKDRLYDLYRLADIGVLVSLSEQNSFSVLEMMSFGVPVVVTDNEAFRHLKGDREVAVFIPLLEKNRVDVSALEKRLEWLIKSRTARDRVGSSSKTMIMQRFTVNDVKREMERVYLLKPAATDSGCNPWDS